MKQNNGFVALLWAFLRVLACRRSLLLREQDYYAIGLILLWLLLFLCNKLNPFIHHK